MVIQPTIQPDSTAENPLPQLATSPLADSEASSRHASRLNRRSCVRRRMAAQPSAWHRVESATIRCDRFSQRPYCNANQATSNPPMPKIFIKISTVKILKFSHCRKLSPSTRNRSCLPAIQSAESHCGGNFQTVRKFSTAKFSGKFCNLAAIFRIPTGIVAGMLDGLSNSDNITRDTTKADRVNRLGIVKMKGTNDEI